MLEGYFNFSARVASGGWERRSFLGAWQRMMAVDRRWTPPYRPALSAALREGRVPYMDRQQPACIWVEALPGKPNYSGALTHRQLTSALMEQPVATALLLADPRRRDGTATLALLHCANDAESLARLLTVAFEQAWARGRSRLVGPAALSPHLGYGALTSHYHEFPPLHTPYQAPYLPEILESAFDPGPGSHLYVAATEAGALDSVTLDDPATLRLLQAGDERALVARLLTALDSDPVFPAPDEVEARFVWAWWQVAPLTGVVAEVQGQVVGAVLLQADLAAALRWAKGAANPLRRLWWAWRRTRGATAGRLLALVVAPEYRRRGIGHRLWRAGLALAHAYGWATVSIGPVADESPAAAFLTAQGAIPRQRYRLYVAEG